MVRERIPESREVEEGTITVFSRVAGWTGYGAAWRVRAIMAQPFAAGDLVVDIGTGPGTIPLHLQRFFPEACFFGLDVAPAMLAQARHHSRRMAVELPLLCAQGESLPFGDNTLDMAISFFTMHHIDEPGRLLAEVDRVLKPDGKFLLIDFRRDMPAFIYHAMNAFWQLAFLFSPGRRGLMESIDSAWTPAEISESLTANGLSRFRVSQSRTELLITAGIKKFEENPDDLC